jgi:hypothetical protein
MDPSQSIAVPLLRAEAPLAPIMLNAKIAAKAIPRAPVIFY